MSSLLSHIAHGVESGLMTLATTGNPALAAGAGIAGAVCENGARSANAGPGMTQAAGGPLLQMLRAENPTERQNVNALSSFADLIYPAAAA
ncbi:MAG: hypothetical protein ABR508_09975 [Candidatus Baltobacteraceae bacterium]